MAVVGAVLCGLGVLGLAAYVFIDRDGGKEWFYWAAPLLSLAMGGMFINLAVQYWRQVGKLEVRGRPRQG
jgi:hypothetical protein